MAEVLAISPVGHEAIEPMIAFDMWQSLAICNKYIHICICPEIWQAWKKPVHTLFINIIWSKLTNGDNEL